MKNPFKLKSQKDHRESFIDSLQRILDLCKEVPEITIRQIFSILSGKGYAALLIIFSLPFCTPIQIPGFSTPFGLVLAFIGLRIVFAKRLWWPKWILDKKLKSEHVEKAVRVTIKGVQVLQKVLHPRLQILTENPILHRLHGILVFVFALFLSLPLPIPMTNLLAALPILFIGLGLLEDDGAAILIAYLLALMNLGLFIGLFLIGKAQLAALTG
jgi:hypothetical protein